MRVLIVDDEEYLADAVAHILKKRGYDVDIAEDGELGLKYARDAVYDVIVLDVMLPKIDGITVVNRLRKDGLSTPVIMLSAKGELTDRVDGLDAGADDYLAKPFKTAELLARIRALTRRTSYKNGTDGLALGKATLSYDDASLSTDEKSYHLTAKEFAIAEIFATQPNIVVNKKALFKRVWGQDMFEESKYVEVYISFLRKKLREVGAGVTIQAVRGLGYRLIEATA